MSLFGPPNVERLEKKRDVPGLIEALGYAKEGKIGGVRYDAAEALGKIGDKRAVAPLCAALKDSDMRVRDRAAMALGEIGDARAVEPLCAALKDSYVDVRMSAAAALGYIGGTSAVEALGEIARKGSNKGIRDHAAFWLDNIAKKDSSIDMQRLVAKALGEADDAHAVERLCVALRSCDGSERGRLTPPRRSARSATCVPWSRSAPP